MLFKVAGIVALLLFLQGCSEAEEVRSFELWSDQPLLALYAEVYNASQEETNVEFRFQADVAEALLTEAGSPDLAVGLGLANRNLSPYVQEVASLIGNSAEGIYPPLLELGRYNGSLRFLPLAFDLPAIEALDTTFTDQGLPLLSIEDLRERGAALNQAEEGRFFRMGFSPLWDHRFLLAWAQIEGAGFTEIEELRVAWDQEALETLMEEGITWREEVNGGGAAATAFRQRYLYDTKSKLMRQGRIGFSYTTASAHFSQPDAQVADLEIRWLYGEERIPVLPEVIYAAIPSQADHRREAAQFLRWLLDPTTQRAVMETTVDRRLDSFGFITGFSSLEEVNRSVFPELYPSLMGKIPPAERLQFPRQTPLNWAAVEEEVVGPWLRESIRLQTATEPREPETGLGEAIDQWYRARGL